MFKGRASECELLDRPDSDPRLAEQSYHFMRSVNHVGGGTRAVRAFLARELSGRTSATPIRIVDLGTGGGDIPVALSEWAASRGHHVEFTCVDHHAAALALARKWADAAPGTIRFQQADIFEYHPAEAFDYAIASMFLHHFSADEIDRLICHLRRFVRKALFVNDLHRGLLNYAACYLATLGRAAEIRHDALLSVRRGFRRRDLRRIADRHDRDAVIRRRWFCRITGVVRFDWGGAV